MNVHTIHWIQKLVLQCKMEVKYLLDIAPGEEAISIHASNPKKNWSYLQNQNRVLWMYTQSFEYKNWCYNAKWK